MDGKVNDWIEVSEYDLETAQVMLRNERYLYVGFMCHQAIEKVLKAHYLLTANAAPPRTGDLRLLARETGLLSHFTEEQISFLLVLETLSIEVRHPEFKDGISAFLDGERCRELISSTAELHAWIKERLSERRYGS